MSDERNERMSDEQMSEFPALFKTKQVVSSCLTYPDSGQSGLCFPSKSGFPFDLQTPDSDPGGGGGGQMKNKNRNMHGN